MLRLSQKWAESKFKGFRKYGLERIDPDIDNNAPRWRKILAKAKIEIGAATKAASAAIGHRCADLLPEARNSLMEPAVQKGSIQTNPMANHTTPYKPQNFKGDALKIVRRVCSFIP
ncbi:hypothetical protein [Brevundimonas sp. TSRC1-1]|jgi:hypothetical protein|uniref:Uncharacterized protein n=1 Tax=Brevundimonas mediterranea TaxID=74329 RepID=A0A7Z8Y2F1_9CAUL|nr:hypothetical protein BREV_BREV_03588 [Brevundimonas mediterranea]